MAGLGDMLPNLPNIKSILTILLWCGVALIIGLALGGLLYLFIIKAHQKNVYELNMINNRIKQYNARERRNRSHQKQLYIGGAISKFLPRVQQKDIFMKGGKENIFLLKDNNGMHHTLRIPTEDELINFYKAQGVDIIKEVKKIKEAQEEDEKTTILQKLKTLLTGTTRRAALDTIGTIYLLPNPLENIEWLADEQNQANNTFGTGLMKHPMLVLFGTLVLCGMIFILTLVVTKLM